jgi:hypothetical protein
LQRIKQQHAKRQAVEWRETFSSLLFLLLPGSPDAADAAQAVRTLASL